MLLRLLITAGLTAAFEGQKPLFAALTEPHNQSPPLAQRLDDALRLVEDIRKIGGTAGMSIGVMYKGDVLVEHHTGFADVENARAPSSSTRYPLGSLTKAFVAATAAQLVDDGLLEWDASISKYVPDLSFDADPSLAGRLTLLDLLSHQTGLVRLDALWLGADGQVNIPKADTVRMCNHLYPVRPLRASWLYNNWMYALAGQVIERVAGSSFGEVLAARVLDKLSLSQTSLIDSQLPADSTARPYLVQRDKTPVRMAADLGMTDGSLMSPAGGVRSTVRDMLKWGHALLGPFRDETTLGHQLDSVLSGHAFLNRSRASDELYALGFAKVTTPAQFGKMGFNPGLVDEVPVIGAGSKSPLVFYHNGAITGYNNCLMLVPDLQAVIVVLTNSISQGDVADWAAQTLLQAVLDTPSPTDLRPLAQEAADKWIGIHRSMSDKLERERVPGTKEPAHSELVGSYRHGTGALTLEVFEEPGGSELRFSINGETGQTHALRHYHNDSFIFLPSDSERIRRGLFHYGTDAWLLHFRAGSSGRMSDVVWNLDGDAPAGEAFVKLST